MRNDKIFNIEYTLDSAKGGVATCIKDKHSTNALKISVGKTEEYIVTRHNEFVPALNVINYYGKQESRQTVDEINSGWEQVLEEIIAIESKAEHLLLLGDLNRHIGKKLVPGNHNKVTHAGKLLLGLLEKESLTLVNSTDKVINGPFTRYDVADPDNNVKKSLLDIVVISAELRKYVDKLEIDSKLEWTPSRSVNGSLKHPDHYALQLVFKNIPMKETKPTTGSKHIVWNTRKKDGWLKYKEVTEDNSIFNDIADMETDDPQSV